MRMTQLFDRLLRGFAVLAFVGLPFAIPAAAPDLTSSALQRARGAQRGRAPVLHVVRPAIRETYDRRVGFAGATNPDARVTVNGDAVRVHSTGAFAGAVDLQPGENSIVIEARSNEGVTVVRRTVRCLASTAAPLQVNPPVIDTGRPMQPSQNLALAPGGWFRLSFQGSPGARAEFRVGESAWRPMREAQTDGKGTGAYEATYRIQPGDDFDEAPARFRLTKSESAEKVQVAQAEPPGKISVIDPAVAPVVEITQDESPLYTSPAGRARLANLPEGVRLSVIGRVGDRLKVRLSGSLSGWVRARDTRQRPDGEPLPVGVNNTVETSVTDGGTTITLDLGARLPFAIRESNLPPEARLRVYNAQGRAWWLRSEAPDDLVGEIDWDTPEDEVVEVRAALRNGLPWGYELRYDAQNRLHWTLFAPPRLAPTSQAPLRGLTVVLDPGHGGGDYGATGSTGLLEKSVNLALAEALAGLLRDAGAKVAMTRDRDVFITLAGRVDFARRRQSGIFISIHNNSVDAVTDPLARRGALVIDHHPHSRPLSEAVFKRLAALIPPEEHLGIVQGDYEVVRNLTQMPAILIEGQYITHPEDEARLMSGKFLDSFAEAIYKGVLDFAQSRTRRD